jgi:hypothetical protein
MLEFNDFLSINTPRGHHPDHQEYTIHDAVVRVELEKLANDEETRWRIMGHLLMNELPYRPIDQPTGCSMEVRLKNTQKYIESECTIEENFPVERQSARLIVPAAWLRGEAGDDTLFAFVIDPLTPGAQVVQRVILMEAIRQNHHGSLYTKYLFRRFCSVQSTQQ